VFVVSKRVETSTPHESIGRLELPRQVAKKVTQAGGYEKVVSGIPSRGQLSTTAKHHLALSDSKRLKILWALSSSDLCPCLLKKITKISDSRLSYHLRKLEENRLIRSRRSKSWRIYTITDRGRESLRHESPKVKASLRSSP